MSTSPRRVPTHARRGRPPKYGQPGQIVAVTLPQRVVRALADVHSDLGWAIVSLVEKSRGHLYDEAVRDVQLVEVGDDQFLIVVNPAMFHGLAGVQLLPLSATQAFLALEPGRGMTDLEVAVSDRLEQLKGPSRERRAVARLGGQLRSWRRDRHIDSSTRSIILLSKHRPAHR